MNGSSLYSIVTLVLMFVIFYFLLIRPQQKRQKQVRQMQSEMKKGDGVVTIGCLHGVIHSLDEATVVISIESGTKLKFDRNAIREVRPAATVE